MGTDRPMRKKNREITDPAIWREILDANNTAVLSMIDGGEPYGVMMNYAPVYQNDRIKLVFHAALEGRKVDCLRSHPQVSVFINDAGRTRIISAGAESAHWTTHYRSLILTGKARFVEDPAAKRTALVEFMRHYTAGPIAAPDEVLAITLFFEVEVERITGKENPSSRQ